MIFFVYVIRNSVTGKIYIGQTNNIEERLRRHNGIVKNKKTSYTAKNISIGNWETFILEKELKSY